MRRLAASWYKAPARLVEAKLLDRRRIDENLSVFMGVPRTVSIVVPSVLVDLESIDHFVKTNTPGLSAWIKALLSNALIMSTRALSVASARKTLAGNIV